MESTPRQFPTAWTKLELGAVWLFLYQRVLPLVDERNIDDRPISGCGCLLRVGSRTFFITAAHVFDTLLPRDFDHIGVPVGPYETKVITLGPGVIHRTNETVTADVDVAIFPLSDEVMAKLKWDGLTVKNLVALRPVSAMNECMSSKPFGQASNRFKRGSGSPELKLLLQTDDAAGVVARRSCA